MSRTHFDGPLASGDKQAGTPGGANVGLAVLAQSVTLQRDATLVQTATINLPAGSQILDIVPDVVVAYDSATSAGLTVGTVGSPPAYVSGVNAKTVGRAAPVFSGGQLLAMNNIGTNTAVVVTVTSVGQPTVGTVGVTILYVQK